MNFEDRAKRRESLIIRRMDRLIDEHEAMIHQAHVKSRQWWRLPKSKLRWANQEENLRITRGVLRDVFLEWLGSRNTPETLLHKRRILT